MTTITLKSSGDLITETDYNALVNKIQNGTDTVVKISSALSSGNAIAIAHSGTVATGRGITISSSSDNPLVEAIPSSSTCSAAVIAYRGGAVEEKSALLQAWTDSATNIFYRNLTAASTGGPVVFIHNDHASDDQVCLSLQQDAPTIAFLDFVGGSGAGVNYNVNTTENSTFAAMIAVNVNGTKRWLKTYTGA